MPADPRYALRPDFLVELQIASCYLHNGATVCTGIGRCDTLTMNRCATHAVPDSADGATAGQDDALVDARRLTTF